jgi:hypothetical protein
MSPDDHRHGTHAGAIQHWRDGEQTCDGCALAARRLRKRNEIATLEGRTPTVDLGEEAWQIINTTPMNQLAAQIGMKHHRLIRYRNGGPTMRVHRTTRDRILAGRIEWTPLGLQRRLQALSSLGWSMRIISNETGVDMDALKRLRRRERIAFVRLDAGRAIAEAYDRLHMTIPPPGKSSSRARSTAIREGWLPPLVWDDIDHDEAPAVDTRGDHVDPVVVMRLLQGDRVNSSRAEKIAALEQWVTDGGSERELCYWHGLKAGRYRTGLRLVDGGAA